MKITMRTVQLCFFLYFLFLSTDIFAGDFSVSPIRLFLDNRAKTGSITVKNEGNEALNVQMKAYVWSQDSKGKDVYTETSDIVFFPKMMKLNGREEQVLRVGIKTPATSKEKTYRLFIEEIPKPTKQAGQVVRVAIKFGVPIFVKPIQEEKKIELENVTMSEGVLNIRIRNSGNVHFNIDSLNIIGKNSQGQKVYSNQLSGQYVLAGVSKVISQSIPLSDCNQLSQIQIEFKANDKNLSNELNVQKSQCK